MRILVASGSLAAFFGGWALLAHAPKPASADVAVPADVPQIEQPQTLPTLAPLRSTSRQRVQPLPQIQPQRVQRLPRMRTGGS